ncbi:MAG: ROK family protein [Cyanobacteria bacterium]|nr:ROK family protein [Cyanobacteriota bacterium]
MSKTESIEPARLDELAKNKLPALGIDLGGTKIRACVVKERALVGKPVQIATPEGPNNILRALEDLIKQFQEKHSLLAGVGIATAGIVNCDTGEVMGSTGNIPGWAGTPVKRIIESRVLLPVHVDNDANAAAYGEYCTDELRDKKILVAVTLGTGIGGGIVIDGQQFRGTNWGGAEIGHIQIAQGNKRLCTCGLFDCWEAYGSGRGLLMTAKEFVDGVAENQSPLANCPDSLSTYAIFAAASKGDILAQKIVHRWLEHLAIGMVNIAHILNPDCFVITGGLADSVDLSLLEDMVVDRCLPRIGEVIEVRKSSLEGNAGLIGAAQFVLDHLLKAK